MTGVHNHKGTVKTTAASVKSLSTAQLGSRIRDTQHKLEVLNRHGADRTTSGKKKETSLFDKLKKYTTELLHRSKTSAKTPDNKTPENKVSPEAEKQTNLISTSNDYKSIENAITGQQAKVDELEKELLAGDPSKPDYQIKLAHYQDMRAGIRNMIEMLSNLMKQDSDTAKHIIGNI